MKGKFLFIAGGVCGLLALGLWLIPAGYNMSALCCAGVGACCVFYGLVRRRGTKNARRLGIAAAVLLSIGFGCFLAAEIPVFLNARSDEDTSADYIIVMGAWVNGTTPSLSLTDRLEGALLWLEENPAAVAVVSGGQGKNELVTEARAMADWLTARGVDPGRILLEEQAENSYENILYSLKIIEENGGDPAGRVALLSSDYHLCRLRYMAQRLGCEPVCVSAPTSRFSLMINYAIREAFAMWKCWVFGIK